MAKLRLTYTKSVIGYSKDQKATIKSLGLRKLNSTVIQDDTPSIRGMAFKVRHLISVDEVDEATATAPSTLKLTTQPSVISQPASSNSAPVPGSSATTVDLGSVPMPIPSATTVNLGSVPAPAVLVPVVAGTSDSHVDDLKVIEGIGPKIASLLIEHDITTFAQLAETSVDQLSSILVEANLRRLADPATWPEQARLAANGQMDQLKALQDVLQGGRTTS